MDMQYYSLGQILLWRLEFTMTSSLRNSAADTFIQGLPRFQPLTQHLFLVHL